MNIFFGIIVWLGCWFAAMGNLPEYFITNAISRSGDGKVSYFLIKLTKRTYKLMFLIFLNVFCFASQFCAINNDLSFVLFVINIIFFFNALWEVILNSYNKNYIALLQSKLVSHVELLNIFDLNENCEMPNEYDSNGIYLLIKNKVYYKDDKYSLCLTPKTFGLKKSPIKTGEIKFIVSQLNNNEIKFNQDVKVDSFYRHPDLYEYSDYFVFDEIKNNKVRRWLYKCVRTVNNILSPILFFVYLGLGIIAFASMCGSNWCSWFTLLS